MASPGQFYTQWIDVWEWKGDIYEKRNNHFPEIYKELIQNYNSGQTAILDDIIKTILDV